MTFGEMQDIRSQLALITSDLHRLVGLVDSTKGFSGLHSPVKDELRTQLGVVIRQLKTLQTDLAYE